MNSKWRKSILALSLGLLMAVPAGMASAADAAADPWMAPLPQETPAPQHADHGADNFYKSDRVTMTPVTFQNQFDMTVAGNLYIISRGRNCRLLLSATPWERLRNRLAHCMHRKWQKEAM